MKITMAAANAIKSKRIIELTSGEAGIVNHTDKVYLLDWMQNLFGVPRETRQERHRSNQGRYPYPERICRGKVLLDRVDLAFCQGYIDYMLTTFRPKGKPIAASTRNTYYQIFNGALNAAVRAKRLLRNPFEMENGKKCGERAVLYDHRKRALIATGTGWEG